MKIVIRFHRHNQLVRIHLSRTYSFVVFSFWIQMELDLLNEFVINKDWVLRGKYLPGYLNVHLISVHYLLVLRLFDQHSCYRRHPY